MILTFRVLRRRAGLLTLTAAANLVVSSIAITPWSEAIASGSLVNFPDPDAALLADGGMILVEWLRMDGPALLGALRATLLLGSVSALVLLFPVALLMLGLSDSEKLSFGGHAQRAFRALPRFLLVYGGTLLCQAILIALVALLYGLGMGAQEPWAYPWLTLGFGVLGLVVWGLPSLLQDLVRAQLLDPDRGVIAALVRACSLFASRPLELLIAYALPALIGWCVAAGAVALTSKSATIVDAGLRQWSQFALHQACVVVLVVLRACWLERAIRLTSSSLPVPVDKRADSAGQADPNPDPGA